MTSPLTPVPPPAAQSHKPQTSGTVVAAHTPQRDMLTMLAVGVVVVTALYVGRDIILPLVLAAILAFVLTPIVNFLRRFRIPRAPAVILSVVFALTVLTTLAFLMTSQVAQLAGDLPRYEATIQQKVSGIQQGVLGRVSTLAENLGRRFERATETPSTPAEKARAQQVRPLPVELHVPEQSPLQLAQRFILPALHPLATFAITFVVLIFILLQRGDLRDRVIRLFGSRDLHRTTIAMDDAAIRLSRYFFDAGRAKHCVWHRHFAPLVDYRSAQPHSLGCAGRGDAVCAVCRIYYCSRLSHGAGHRCRSWLDNTAADGRVLHRG